MKQIIKRISNFLKREVETLTVCKNVTMAMLWLLCLCASMSIAVPNTMFFIGISLFLLVRG